MNIEISIKTRNTLTDAEKAIRRVPEVYRKELCNFLKDKFENPQTYLFRHTNSAVIDSFHEVSKLYSKLCDTDKEQFKKSFSKIARQFGA
ncbi:MAG: hypothetical protein J6A04_02145 [Clostridia bacterium]|nr:hypothetical protein [Clostridia bacterium]